MDLGPLTPAETAVRTALRNALPQHLQLEDLVSGDFAIDQLSEPEVAHALSTLDIRKMAVQTFTGWTYVEAAPEPGDV